MTKAQHSTAKITRINLLTLAHQLGSFTLEQTKACGFRPEIEKALADLISHKQLTSFEENGKTYYKRL